jgi:ferredoxin
MAHKITVDQNKCIGCGACVATCPISFELKNGKAFVKKSSVKKLTCEIDAESGCPVEAIKVD